MRVTECTNCVEPIDNGRRVVSSYQPEQLAEPTRAMRTEDRNGSLAALDGDDQLTLLPRE
jgi:hypothetical protein